MLVVRGLLTQHLHNFLNTILICFDTPLSEDLEGDLVTVVRNYPETRVIFILDEIDMLEGPYQEAEYNSLIYQSYFTEGTVIRS